MVSLNKIASGAQAINPTKRNIVSLVGRLYDPLGVLSPVMVRFNMFFQELYKAQID